VDRNGDPYIAGFSSGDAFIAKYSANGTSLWNRTQSGAIFAVGQGVAVDAGGNAFLVGYKDNATGYYHTFIDKFSASGIPLWSRLWINSTDDEGYGVIVDARGNPAITGSTNTPSDGSKAFIAQFTNSGTSMWNLTWGYDGSSESGYAITTDTAGNMYLAGSSYLVGAFLAKFGYPPSAPVLSAISPSYTSYGTGTLSLSWSTTSWTTNYCLYRYSSWISSLNDSVTLVGNFTSTTAEDTGLNASTYYYVVVAENGNWSSPISNCEKGIVAPSPSTPGFGETWIVVFAGLGITCVVLKRRSALQEQES
jgi:hypothetical protein